MAPLLDLARSTIVMYLYELVGLKQAYQICLHVLDLAGGTVDHLYMYMYR